VASGGRYIAVWGAVHGPASGEPRTPPQHAATARGMSPPRPPLGAQIDRAAGRWTAQALIGLRSTREESDRRKEDYNAAAPADWPHFATDMRPSLALYDALDGTCGNQWLAARTRDAAERYELLAGVLADDRLWIDSSA